MEHKAIFELLAEQIGVKEPDAWSRVGAIYDKVQCFPCRPRQCPHRGTGIE